MPIGESLIQSLTHLPITMASKASSSATTAGGSPAWQYFDKCADESNAKCKLCKKVVSRGRADKPGSLGTSPLLNHLKRHHPDIAKAITEAAEAEAASKTSTKTTKKEKVGPP
jgi:hypothetical protein